MFIIHRNIKIHNLCLKSSSYTTVQWICLYAQSFKCPEVQDEIKLLNRHWFRVKMKHNASKA